MKYLIITLISLSSIAFGNERERIVDLEVEKVVLSKSQNKINFNDMIVDSQKERREIRKDITTIVGDIQQEDARERQEIHEFIKIEMDYSKKDAAGKDRMKSELGITPDTDSDANFFRKDQTRDPSSDDGSDDEIIIEISSTGF